MKLVEQTFSIGLDVVHKIKDTQAKAIEEAGITIANAHSQGHRFLVTGSGHSHSVAEEFYGRAGGLAFVVPMMPTELTLNEHPTKSSLIENLDGYGDLLVDLFDIQEGDVVLIASNSGRNPYPVEVAVEAKRRKATVIAITNVHHSMETKPRNKHNKRLLEVADIVIDNCGQKGDAASYFEGIDIPMYPTSSIANAFICGAISVVCASTLAQNGQEVEVFVSANVDGGFEKNDAFMKKYARLYTK
ncbi:MULTISPECIES: SIS domain-containing protein [unclassified Breznakia]|uniref:SIS domain-containing protein n=1 Tax=unclassified Breznakia TaxID=2623764 RepID=UPI0024765814|nr:MULTISPECIES: SIS domain-containing protein [unclassified Breznakia]MDH6366202.1 putative phosphosugar-binding protein [Breznakia sp. PH1-1]MDH6403295.1 putative phosphosugar-binding protein [Breznakia sp. PF1-11]MDH6411004.1 putative phosphosugar-binding protein [Breznakia sp. PFB1-11]MDH6413368.1 putative phosphosugar-binding protein [Breznakia sp. PFB1-14]MDH6416133.1 putative phosphosugar-binding protein [Breznakia sp. PFB1-4]